MPKTIGNISFLDKLDVYHNKLSGTIPAAICNLSGLGKLYL